MPICLDRFAGQLHHMYVARVDGVEGPGHEKDGIIELAGRDRGQAAGYLLKGPHGRFFVSVASPSVGESVCRNIWLSSLRVSRAYGSSRACAGARVGRASPLRLSRSSRTRRCTWRGRDQR